MADQIKRLEARVAALEKRWLLELEVKGKKHKGLTDATQLFENIGKGIEQGFDTFSRKVGTKVKALRERIEAAEEFPFEFRDIWKPGTYKRNSVVVRSGSMWVCKADSTTDEPGKSHAWRLCVKRGKDGRDGKDAT